MHIRWTLIAGIMLFALGCQKGGQEPQAEQGVAKAEAGKETGGEAKGESGEATGGEAKGERGTTEALAAGSEAQKRGPEETVADSLKPGDGAVARESAPGQNVASLQAKSLAAAAAFDISLTQVPSTARVRVLEQYMEMKRVGINDGLKALEGLPEILVQGATREEAADLARRFDDLGAELVFAPGKPRPKVVLPKLPETPVGIDHCPSKGPADAPVVVVEFTDFQCPFCKKGAPVVEAIASTYPEDVRVHVCQLPLAFHKRAEPAALAAYAAYQQGKYWEYYDLLWANNRKLGDEDLLSYARQLGLDVEQFRKDMASLPVRAQVEHQANLAAALGVRGTPNFYVNGENIRGAKPFDAFQPVIDRKLAEARKLVDNGLKRSDAHARATATALDGLYRKYIVEGIRPGKAAAAPRRAEPPKEPLEATVHELAIGDSPRLGKGEEVVIIEFSDFQCPFCSRVGPLVKSVQKHFGPERASLSFKHFPLSFHKNAQLAAEASMAAHAQGRFWEMHDRLFANQKQLTRSDLERYAEEIGLDLGAFKGALDNGTYAKRVQDDFALGRRAGVGGTPTIYVNGRKYQGKRDVDSMVKVIEEQLLKK